MTPASALVRPLHAATKTTESEVETNPIIIDSIKDTPTKNTHLAAMQKPPDHHPEDSSEVPILKIHACDTVGSEPEAEEDDEEVLFPAEQDQGEVPGDEGDAPVPPCDAGHPLRQRVRGLPKPITPTKAQRELHDLTHLPYEPWC